MSAGFPTAGLAPVFNGAMHLEVSSERREAPCLPRLRVIPLNAHVVKVSHIPKALKIEATRGEGIAFTGRRVSVHMPYKLARGPATASTIFSSTTAHSTTSESSCDLILKLHYSEKELKLLERKRAVYTPTLTKIEANRAFHAEEKEEVEKERHELVLEVRKLLATRAEKNSELLKLNEWIPEERTAKKEIQVQLSKLTDRIDALGDEIDAIDDIKLPRIAQAMIRANEMRLKQEVRLELLDDKIAQLRRVIFSTKADLETIA